MSHREQSQAKEEKRYASDPHTCSRSACIDVGDGSKDNDLDESVIESYTNRSGLVRTLTVVCTLGNARSRNINIAASNKRRSDDNANSHKHMCVNTAGS